MTPLSVFVFVFSIIAIIAGGAITFKFSGVRGLIGTLLIMGGFIPLTYQHLMLNARITQAEQRATEVIGTPRKYADLPNGKYVLVYMHDPQTALVRSVVQHPSHTNGDMFLVTDMTPMAPMVEVNSTFTK